MKVKSTHPFAYHSGEWATILEVTGLRLANSDEVRPVFVVKYSEGEIDLLPMYDPSNPLEFRL